MNIELVKQFTKDHLKGEKTGHDYYHGQRVANLATKMYLSDYPDAHKDSRIVAIIQTGSYLHETIDEKICDNPDEVIDEIKELLRWLYFFRNRRYFIYYSAYVFFS